VCPYCETEHRRDACTGENVCAKGFGLAPVGAIKNKNPLTKTETADFISKGLKIDPNTGYPAVQSKAFTAAGQHQNCFVPAQIDEIAVGDRFENQLFRRLARFSEVQLSQEI
jgi:hypothetical protein